MSDAARLARQAFEAKPKGKPYSKFILTKEVLQNISDKIVEAATDTAYASVISYAEALNGLRIGSSSWSVVRLYYSSFYTVKSILLLHGIVPFNSGKDEMLLDTSNGMFLKGGDSSHKWNWASIRSTCINNQWVCSQDSEEAYTTLRAYREDVNYKYAFTDPKLHKCLASDNHDLTRRFRSYRDDSEFLYTYLPDHVAIAYPTKLIFLLDEKIRTFGAFLTKNQVAHARFTWKIKDRCPLT